MKNFTYFKFYILRWWELGIRNLAIFFQKNKVNFFGSGYSWYHILDALFVSSFFLLLFKFAFRIIFVKDPIWYLNLIVAIISFFCQLFFPIIIAYIYKYFALFIIVPTGYPFYAYYDTSTDEEIINDSFFSPEFDINKGNILNKIFQSILFFLTLLRLWLFKRVKVFILLNILLSYFLLTNKFLITSSIISLILILSRY